MIITTIIKNSKNIQATFMTCLRKLRKETYKKVFVTNISTQFVLVFDVFKYKHKMYVFFLVVVVIQYVSN